MYFYVISEARPTEVTETWRVADTRARATIGLCVDDFQTCLIRNCTSAKACWDALQQYHDQGSEVYLLKKLTKMELAEGDDMEQHLQVFTDLLQRIANTGDEIPAKWQVAMLLCSMPDSYDPLTTALEQRPRNELTLDLVKSKLLAEAEKRRERQGCSEVTGDKALKTDINRFRNSYDRSGAGANSERGGKESRNCHYCRRPGHLKKNCWKLCLKRQS